MATGTSFGIAVLAAVGLLPSVFITGGVSGSLAGEEYRPLALLTLTLAAGLIAGGLAILASWGRPTWRSLAGLVAVGLAVGAMSLSTTNQDLPFRTVIVANKCAGSSPEVCISADAASSLPDLVVRFERYSAPLRSAGVSLPSRWTQPRLSGPLEPGAGIIDLSVDSQLATKALPDDVIWSLTQPGSCSAFGTTEPEASIKVRERLVQWIRSRNGLRPTSPEGDPNFREWLDSPAATQWVQSVYPKLRRCALDEL